MKYKIQIFFLAVGVIIFSSCDKEELELSDELKGTWEWYSTCGGIVGCRYATEYPDEDMYKIVIDDLTIQTIDRNGKTTTAEYQINSDTIQDNSRIYEIELKEGTKYTAYVKDNSMTTDNATGLPFLFTYKRVK